MESISGQKLDSRERSILCGLFLSKFDRAGLELLGFDSFSEAFQVLGYGLGAKPASIKNYRDELDPVLSTTRTGWNQRPMREHCRVMLSQYGDFSMQELASIIRSIAMTEEAPTDVRIEVGDIHPSAESSFAKRLITGRAAEQYFVENAGTMPGFVECTIEDATHWGCGFDFKLNPRNGAPWQAVEVKGLAKPTGTIQLTSGEYDTALRLKERYHVVVVSDFIKKPRHDIFSNPSADESGLKFLRTERQESVVSWKSHFGRALAR